MTYFHRSTDIVNRGSVVGIILLQMQILIDDKNVKSNFKKLKNQVFKYEELTERYFLVTFGKDVTILFPVKKTDQNDINNIFIICLSIPYLRFEKKNTKMFIPTRSSALEILDDTGACIPCKITWLF